MGFTLVELLIVIAIIGILVLLLLPAVQQAREAARRLSCKNNLKQMAMAALQHHQQSGNYPTGGWGWDWIGDADRGHGRHQPGGWAFNILPFMEQGNLYEKAGDGDPNAVSQQQLENARFVQRTVLAMYTCPSRRGAQRFQLQRGTYIGENAASNFSEDNTVARSDYAINCGDQKHNEFFAGPRISGFDFANDDAWSGWHDKDWLTGISFERSEIRNIIDGASNTYLIGEKYINADHYTTGRDPSDNEGWCTGYDNDNYRNGYYLPIQDRAGYTSTMRFGSVHANGFNISLCDASVHTINYSISEDIHRRLANRRNGDNMGIDIDDL
jgi:prepilin-type N-terminal cleavage/methylation domain-containing protein